MVLEDLIREYGRACREEVRAAPGSETAIASGKADQVLVRIEDRLASLRAMGTGMTTAGHPVAEVLISVGLDRDPTGPIG